MVILEGRLGEKFMFQIETFLFMTPGILSFVFRSESSHATCDAFFNWGILLIVDLPLDVPYLVPPPPNMRIHFRNSHVSLMI